MNIKEPTFFMGIGACYLLSLGKPFIFLYQSGLVCLVLLIKHLIFKFMQLMYQNQSISMYHKSHDSTKNKEVYKEYY